MAHTAINREQTFGEEILSLNEHMEELAGAAEWRQVFEILGKRNAMLLELEGSERAEALLAAKRSTEQLRLMADNARQIVAKKLTDLARGKKATDSYRRHA